MLILFDQIAVISKLRYTMRVQVTYARPVKFQCVLYADDTRIASRDKVVNSITTITT